MRASRLQFFCESEWQGLASSDGQRGPFTHREVDLHLEEGRMSLGLGSAGGALSAVADRSLELLKQGLANG